MGCTGSENEGRRLSGERASRAGADCSVLVVERSASTRDLMREALRSQYRVALAATYEDALRAVGDAEYDGILVSLYPGEWERGAEVLAELRTAISPAALIAVCGPASAQELPARVEGEVDDLLRRPFAASDLHDRLERHLGGA